MKHTLIVELAEGLADLVERGILRQHGRGKGSYFELTR